MVTQTAVTCQTKSVAKRMAKASNNWAVVANVSAPPMSSNAHPVIASKACTAVTVRSTVRM